MVSSTNELNVVMLSASTPSNKPERDVNVTVMGHWFNLTECLTKSHLVVKGTNYACTNTGSCQHPKLVMW